MSMYQPGIPTGTVDLDIDYLNLQRNFTQLDTTFGIDHVTFSNQTAQNGYHTSIHFNPVSTTTTNPPNNQPVVTPVAVPGYGQLFSAQTNDGFSADTALYWLTGNNILIPLTLNKAPVLAFNGYTMLPGGLLMQWGLASPAANTITTINLPIPFPNNFFNVSITPRSIAAGDTGRAYNSGLSLGPPFASFQCKIIGTVAGIFYTAIGN